MTYLDFKWWSMEDAGPEFSRYGDAGSRYEGLADFCNSFEYLRGPAELCRYTV